MFYPSFPRSGFLMFDNMHRLHARGPKNPGICVDRDGAMLGPDCVLVGRTPRGFRGIGREAASALQKCAGIERDDDWLFRQCEYIADSLNKGEIALAQIYGLRIPVGGVDDRLLKRLVTERFTKWSFNPDEPRLPQGDPHGGEWTTGGGAAAAPSGSSSSDATLALVGSDSSGDAAPVSEPSAAAPGDAASSSDASGGGTQPPSGNGPPAGDAQTGNPAAPNRPAMEYRYVPPGAAFAGDGSSWLAGKLATTTLEALKLLLARATGATIVFRILFIPSNDSPIAEGPIANSAGLSYRYNSDTGVLQIRQEIGSLGPGVITEAQLGTDGLFHDQRGQVIGLRLSTGIAVDTDTLPGHAPAANDNHPRLCPDPTPENISGRSERAVAYQSQITGLPPGLEVVFNGERYDGCRESDHHLLEAKGEGYLTFMSSPMSWYEWFSKLDDLKQQIDSHATHALGHIVEYHFAEKQVADWARQYARKYSNVVVYYTPRIIP
jgi:hypothetical protein